MKNKVKVQVCDVTVTISTDYDESYISALAKNVEEDMNGILKQSRYYTKMDAAILRLLDLTDANARLQAEVSKMKKDMQTQQLDLELAQAELEQLRRGKTDSI